MSFSIIMAYRPDNGIRDKHLKWTIGRYRKMFPEAEIVISKDTGAGWDSFCKSRLINQGVEKASYNNLLITDIDVVFKKETIVESFKQVGNYCMIIPMSELWWINHKGTDLILKNKPGELLPITTDIIKKEKRIAYRPNGWHIMTKDSFYNAGGYDERFVGWGGEDSCFIRACVTLNDKPFLRKESMAYHLWHPVDKHRHKKRDRHSGEMIQEYIGAFKDKDKMLAILESRGIKR